MPRKSEMASTTQETLYDNFSAVAAGLSLASTLNDTVSRIAGLQSDASSTANSSGGTGSDVASVVSKVFTSGLGLVPLIGGLFGLFGGGSEQPPPLVKYTMPQALYFQGADTGQSISPGDYDQFGMPRASGASSASTPTSGGAAPATPQITVSVQAMDSRSFLDHSTEIAQAVRQAMLNLSPINDVVSDL